MPATSKALKSNGKQAAKSASTRRATLDAAIQCFIDLGYAKTTTIEVARVAGISRGAMIHHFPTKWKMLEATVEHLINRRIESFSKAISRIKSEEDRLNFKGIDIYWNHLKSDLFVAFHELTVASRTDPDLARIMKAANARFEAEWYRMIRELFPEWDDKGALFDLAMDLTQFLCEGMALNTLSHDARKRRQRIREYLKARLGEIFAATDGGGKEGAVQHFLQQSE